MSVPIRLNLVSPDKYSIKCPHAMTAQYITIHNTANDATAASEINYMIGNTNSTSFHFAVDEKEVVQGIPLDRNAWHCGDGNNGEGNRKSIGVEICYSLSGGDRYYKAEAKAVQLVAQLLKERGWGTERVVTHQTWSGKYCPHRILDEKRWDIFINAVAKEMKPITMVTFYTGGFSSGSLINIHDFLLNNGFYFKPSRGSNGMLFFEIGEFAENGESYIKMLNFLKQHNYWHEIRA